MWTSLPTALIALLLLSDPASARRRRRFATVEAYASEDPSAYSLQKNDLETPAPSVIFSTYTVIPLPVDATPAVILTSFTAIPMPLEPTPAVIETSFTAIPMPIVATPAVILTSFTASPLPVASVFFSEVPKDSELSSAISFPSFPTGTGIPAGIFFTGYGSGSVTGTGTGTNLPRPTGTFGSNQTSNETYHHSVPPQPVNSTSIPFFTLQEPTTTSVSATVVSSLSPSLSQVSPSSTSVALSSPSSSDFLSSIISTLPTLTTKASSTLPLTTSVSSAVSTPTPSSPSNSTVPFLRGVNLGGWLVLEKWMNADAFTGSFASASDQYTFDSISGAASALDTHWSTFFTESDIQTLAATGLNALRIPIGFWAYDNTNTPYQKGADAYLEKAITWARNCGMKVWVDLHGSPGSQNGFDNSGQAGEVNWQQTANLERSISVLKTMAGKYGKQEYADVVVGLELVNEPISWGNNEFSVTQQWAQDAYTAVKAEIENENLVVVMHDAFEGAGSWTDVGEKLQSDSGVKTFGVDTHLYQLFSDADNALTQAQHITAACGWASNLASANAIMPTYVGEWSAATNICVNPDGSTTAGTSCSVSGCQCQSASFDSWNDGMIEQVRRFVEAQLDVFESSSSGYFLWSAKGPGGWGFLNGIGNGAIPNPITERKYPGQCGSSKRRDARGSLGKRAEVF